MCVLTFPMLILASVAHLLNIWDDECSTKQHNRWLELEGTSCLHKAPKILETCQGLY